MTILRNLGRGLTAATRGAAKGLPQGIALMERISRNREMQDYRDSTIKLRNQKELVRPLDQQAKYYQTLLEEALDLGDEEAYNLASRKQQDIYDQINEIMSGGTDQPTPPVSPPEPAGTSNIFPTLGKDAATPSGTPPSTTAQFLPPETSPSTTAQRILGLNRRKIEEEKYRDMQTYGRTTASSKDPEAAMTYVRAAYPNASPAQLKRLEDAYSAYSKPLEYDWNELAGHDGVLYASDPQNPGKVIYTEYTGEDPSPEDPVWMKEFHARRNEILDLASQGKETPTRGMELIDASAAGYGIDYPDALRSMDQAILDGTLTKVDIKVGMQSMQIEARKQRDRALGLIETLKDPNIQERMGTLGVTSFKMKQWYERALKDPKSNDPNHYVDRDVEEFLTLLGLGRDEIVRNRSGAAVPPEEDKRFKSIIGSEWATPAQLAARLRGVVRDANESLISVWETLGSTKFGQGNIPYEFSQKVDIHMFDDDLASRRGELLDIATENKGVLPSMYEEEWNKIEDMLTERGYSDD
jgi:hypothetical protein